MVNGGKMYPKAISMKLEDELNFEKKQNSKTKKNRSSQKSSKSSKTTKSDDKMGTSNVHLDSAFETASTVSSKINDNTLDYGDWAIMEVELIEPSLYFNLDSKAPRRFVEAMLGYLER